MEKQNNMKTRTQEVYRCDHCNKSYFRAWLCGKHEKLCNKNPENKRACYGCVHLSKKSVDLLQDDPYAGEYFKRLDCLHCAIKNTFVYPPKVEHKNNAFDLGDESNVSMPMICDQRKDISDLI